MSINILTNIWRTSVSNKIIVSATVLSIVAVLLSSLFAFRVTQNELERAVEDRMLTIAELQAQHIATELEDKVNLVSATFSSDPTLVGMVQQQNSAYTSDISDIENRLLELDTEWRDESAVGLQLIEQAQNNAVAEGFRTFIGEFPVYAEIFVTDKFGAEVAGSGKTSDYYQADEAWWQSGWNNGIGAIHISNPEVDASAGVVAIDITIPVHADAQAEPIGVIKGVLEITDIIDEVNRFQFARTGTAQIIDGIGNYVVGYEFEDIGELAPSPITLDGRIFDGMSTELNATNSTGNQTVVGFAPVTTGGLIPAIDSLGWVVRIEQDRQEAFQPTRQLLFTNITATFGIAVLAAFFAFLLGRFLTKEIRILTDVATEYAAGNLDARANVPSNDEIGTLADQMNAMAESVQASNDELKRINQEISFANTELRSFTSIVSHDLRSPAASIKGFLNELRMDWNEIQPMLETVRATVPQDDQKIRIVEEYIPSSLDAIENSTAQMERLTEGILKLSREGNRNLVLDPVNSVEIVQAVLKTYATKIKDDSVQIVVQPDLPIVMADALALEQAFSNLIGNALKYLDPIRPGEVHISATTTAEYITFHIRDNGIGIEDYERDKVFQLFRRAGNLDVAGEGIGLYYIRSLMRRHGGDVTFTSQPGTGSTFSFSISTKLEVNHA